VRRGRPGRRALTPGEGGGAALRYDLVIFDNDGVLVDSEAAASRILADLLAACGLPLGAEACREAFTGRSLAGVREEVERRLRRRLPAGFEARYHARLFEAFRTELAAVPGVASALERIRVPTCVASSGSRARIRLALAVTGLLARFEGRIFSADDVARGKPAPDLFLHAARRLGVDPARCAVVEDSGPGVEAANAAGMTAFGFARATPAACLRHARGGVFLAMDELPALLERGPDGEVHP
jgi:HAD superfamily hydrolase (TIGR01509 family)